MRLTELLLVRAIVSLKLSLIAIDFEDDNYTKPRGADQCLACNSRFRVFYLFGSVDYNAVKHLTLIHI